MKQRFYSNGKLLLTGEYAILDGALSLAIPTKYGQTLEVTHDNSGKIKWTSFDHNDAIWFEAKFDLQHPIISKGKTDTGNTLAKILIAAKNLNPDFLMGHGGYIVNTKLDFPLDWGLGSSSTLINNIADWANVDPYRLLLATFGGSGYDIACARHNHPLVYKLEKDLPKVTEIAFDPSFKEQLYFVYLNRKQNSRDGISVYREQHFDKESLINKISSITKKIVDCTDLKEFEELLFRHETLLSQTLGLPTIKTSLFPDYRGEIKSLGAWGGDFILVTEDRQSSDYFKSKGYETIISYQKMVLPK